MLIYVLLAGVANWLATAIITQSTLFAPLRRLAPMLGCPLCAGTWVGFAQAAWLDGPFHSVFWDGLVFRGFGELVGLAVEKVRRA